MRLPLVVAAVLLAPVVASADDVALAPFVLQAAGEPAAPIPARDADLPMLVARADARFGIVRAPAAYAPLGELDPALAAVTADLLHALLWAAKERDAAFAGVPARELDAALAGEGSTKMLARIDEARVRAAAAALAVAVDDARLALEALAPVAPLPRGPVALAPAPAIDLFPVLGIDPLGVPNAYPHDYFLSIDLGGDDVYDNNAGGSIIQRGKSVGDPATWGPEVAVPDTVVVETDSVFLDPGGDIIVGGEFEEGEAVHSATLAIDVAGDDTYGVYKTPTPAPFGIDQRCTSEPVIRRVVVQGSGGAGIGMLVDLDGDDRYRAKTLAQGSGHVAGVGVLFDAQGDDTYTALRTAQGAGLLGGVGVLVDAEGADEHVLASPAGGIFNQPDMRCDASLRIVLGVGSMTGSGLFADLAGDDVYRGAQANALGHADSQSLGVFLDAAGEDDYGGYVARGDGRSVTTTPAGGAGLFRDLS